MNFRYRTRTTSSSGPAHGRVRLDLWDVATGSCFGCFDIQDEALALVRTLVREHGPTSADDLNLGAEDDEGWFAEPLSGTPLLARIETRAPS